MSALRPRAVLAAFLLASAGAAGGAEPALDTRLLFIGDAGDATPSDPVIRALAAEARREPDRTVVVFLGDNVYPKGVPAPDEPGRAAAVARLDAQIRAVAESGARAIFVPGNHDWQESGPDGWARVKRESEIVNGTPGGRVTMRPANGCPGPEVLDFGTRVRLVALDTQWWLHPGTRPATAGDGCAFFREEEVVDALRGALGSSNGRLAFVVAHHPLASGGPHGGAFGVKQHVFPLTALSPWLWIPLPVVGSIYPAARRAGVSDQDLAGKKNVEMRRSLERAFAPAPPFAWVSGHDHGLQVLKPPSGPLLLVSGSGTIANVSHVLRLPETRFRRAQAGFQRVDVREDGSAVLTVVGVGRNGGTQPLYEETMK